MKLLVVQDSLGTGGAERSNAELWYYLKKKGIPLKIVVLRHRSEGTEKEILEDGFDVEFLKSGGIINQAKQVAEIIKNYKPQVVHSVLFKAATRVRLAKFYTKFYHVESLVNCTYHKIRLKDPNVNFLKLQTYRLVDFVTQLYGVDHFHANGRAVAEHYQKQLFIKKSRMTIIPRGRKENKFVGNLDNKNKVRNEFNSHNKVQLINVARHEFQKAQEVILDALDKLQDLKEDYVLLLVGRNGELTDQIKEKIARYELSGSVKLLGHRNDIYQLLAASDIFVFPSRFEGLPGALIEAEAAGLPIVCSNIPNNIEVVQKNKNALVFPMDNEEVLAEYIQDFIMNAQKRKKMGKKSSKIYQEKFTIDKINEQMLEFFKTVRP